MVTVTLQRHICKSGACDLFVCVCVPVRVEVCNYTRFLRDSAGSVDVTRNNRCYKECCELDYRGEAGRSNHLLMLSLRLCSELHGSCVEFCESYLLLDLFIFLERILGEVLVLLSVLATVHARAPSPRLEAPQPRASESTARGSAGSSSSCFVARNVQVY